MTTEKLNKLNELNQKINELEEFLQVVDQHPGNTYLENSYKDERHTVGLPPVVTQEVCKLLTRYLNKLKDKFEKA